MSVLFLQHYPSVVMILVIFLTALTFKAHHLIF